MENTAEEELQLEPATEDENGVTAAEVLAEAEASEQDSGKADTGSGDDEKSMEDKLRDVGAKVEGTIEEGNARISLGEDESFAEDSRARAAFDGMGITPRGVPVEITLQDKVSYLKAMLMDTEVRLEVPLAGGRVTAEYRSLTAYEQDIVPVVSAMYIAKHPSAGFMLLDGIRQHALIAMELVKFNGNEISPARFVPGDHTIEEDAEALIEAGNKLLLSAGPRFAFYVAGADVFHRKMHALGEAALNKDFWDPAFAGL